MKKVLFVCTGNTCRSPMAEALFNFHAREIKNISASSCGIFGDGTSPLSPHAKTALCELGIDFSHISAPITLAAVSGADYIVGMTSNHARSIISMFPEYADKIYAMPRDISDPYGCDLETYRKTRDEIEASVKMLIKTFSGEKND